MKHNCHGSRVETKQPSKRFVGLLALALILICTVSGTVAYLVTHTAPVVNKFIPGYVTSEVKETVEDNVKKDIGVKNTGNVPAYIRVAVVANTVDENGKITGAATLPQGWLNTEDWTKVGDYYYYNSDVQPGDQTKDLLADGVGIALQGKQVTILASAIQSTPDEAVNSAWHMSFSDGSWAPVPSGN